MTDIKLGTKVTAPVSDKDGEVSYIIGTLTDLNSRYATITQSDGTITKVGKSKIEPMADEPKKREKKDNSICPKCKANDQVFDYNHAKGSVQVNNPPYSKMTHRYWCADCDCEWGVVVSKSINADGRNYQVVKAASGRKSLDNGDAVAQLLRGLDLDQVYAKAAELLTLNEMQLRSQYAHLNPGQQRMNLGNRLRKIYRLGGSGAI